MKSYIKGSACSKNGSRGVRFWLLITVLALVALPAQHPFDWGRYNARQGPWGARAGRVRDEDHLRRTELVISWAVIGIVTSVILFLWIAVPWNSLNRVEPKKFGDVRVEEPAGDGEAVRWGPTKQYRPTGSDRVFYVRKGVRALDNKPARCALPGEPALIFGLGQSADLYRARTLPPSGGVIMCWRFVWSRAPGDPAAQSAIGDHWN